MLRTQAANNDSGMFQDEDPGVQLGTSIIADDQNNHQEEIVNSILAAGITLASAQNQLAQAISSHASGADFYTDSGAADAYVLSPVLSFTGTTAYFTGMRIRFVPGNANTGASTVNVNSLGVKSIKQSDGSDPEVGQLIADKVIELYYDGTNFVISKSDFSLSARYRRPQLEYVSATEVDVEDQIFTGTSGDVSVQFPTGEIITQNSLARTRFDITQNAVTTTSGYQSGLRTSLSEANNTWYALYAVKCDDGGFVTVGDTILPLPSNYVTLDSNYGANNWVYLGMIRNGANTGDADDLILEFTMDQSETHFREFTNGGRQLGIRLQSAVSTSVAWTYSAGTGASQIPDHIKNVGFGGFVASGANSLNMEPTSPTNAPLYRASLDADNGYAQVWCSAINGMTVSTGGVSVAANVWLNGFRDPYL